MNDPDLNVGANTPIDPLEDSEPEDETLLVTKAMARVPPPPPPSARPVTAAQTGLQPRARRLVTAPASARLVTPPPSMRLAAPPPPSAPDAMSPPRSVRLPSFPPVVTSSSPPNATPPPATGRWRFLAGVGVAALVSGFGVAAVLRAPDAGSLVVTVGGAPVEGLEILVGSDARCASSPCRLDLAPGTHLVRVRAPGREATADRAVAVRSGAESDIVFDLPVRSAPPTPILAVSSLDPVEARAVEPAPRSPVSPAPPAYGTLVLTSTPPASVIVDGRPLGLTPRTMRTEVGDHTIVFAHEERGRTTRSVRVAGGRKHAVAALFD